MRYKLIRKKHTRRLGFEPTPYCSLTIVLDKIILFQQKQNKIPNHNFKSSRSLVLKINPYYPVYSHSHTAQWCDNLLISGIVWECGGDLGLYGSEGEKKTRVKILNFSLPSLSFPLREWITIWNAQLFLNKRNSQSFSFLPSPPISLLIPLPHLAVISLCHPLYHPL